ncbi:MAG TPA: 2Fe-2S iron-sulfur cluster-binding protein [Pseudolabrys sp.]|jgi:carbon-monoxide dehydrogenase small subunit|nr:2Fe-2S iron-sulfur cluster-binding protein [Pseudolabrys sp.]
MTSIALTLNGVETAADVEPRMHLADFIRETQNLTGTHLGCEHGVCGACTVLVDGVPVRSCITFAVSCTNAEVTTIEGLGEDEIMKELRAAFSREHGLQCGYCTPGMLISARDLVIRAPDADEHDIRVAMSGNLCRCTGYLGIVRAIQSVISDRRAKGIAAVPGAGRKLLGPAGASTTSIQASERRPAVSLNVQSAGEASVLPERSDDFADWKPQATFEQSFVVHHPVAEVWNFFGNVAEVAACLPGASITGDTGGRKVNGKMRVKVGPITADFHGTAEITRNEADHSGSIVGSGRDQRSSSTTRGLVSYRLIATENNGTKVALNVGYRLTGPLAQFSRSDLMQDVAARLTAVFAKNVEARLSGAPQSEPERELHVSGLFFSSLMRIIGARIRRLFGR